MGSGSWDGCCGKPLVVSHASCSVIWWDFRSGELFSMERLPANFLRPSPTRHGAGAGG